jgi:hypothetical protein
VLAASIITAMMETGSTSEALVNVYQIAWRWKNEGGRLLWFI